MGSAAPDVSTREAVKRALSALPDAPLREGAAALLGALGYRSERAAEAGSVAEFLERFADPAGLTARRRALFEPWRAVDVVFQLTDDEIAHRADLLPDRPDRFDRGRIRSFLFLAVDLAGGDPGRARLAETTRAVNRMFAMPAVLLFRRAGSVTLAVVHRRAHRRDPGRDVLEKVTLVKDVRAARPHRAHLDVLADLALPRLIAAHGVADFDGLHAAWEKTLDIEALNRRFYRELFAWFGRAVGACSFPDDGAGEGSAERCVIRLVTRLLFVWFLKEKGLIPDATFTERFARETLKDHGPERTDYYRAVLQNLFFATLNTEIGKRAFSAASPATHRDFNRYRYRAMLADPDRFLEALRRVPFVNGGLFDCLDDFTGGGRRIDAFTDNTETDGRDLRVPARLFLDEADGLFPLFRRWKFTVEENTPLDREVALDPELLGRAFENLLAAHTPETRRTARKATGSYYTPRRVVDHMVREALAEALAERARPADGDPAFWRERLRYLLDWEDAFDDAAELFRPAERESVVRAVAGLRVLDPAAGSGAFPMGVLQTLTLALRRLDPDNALWEAFQKERATAMAAAALDTREEAARNEELAEIGRIFQAYRDSDFGRKLYLIQNSIYGVDIQPIACQIARLRFFVSLAIEQETGDDPADNYGVRPLPNLETRFVAADALIGLARPDQFELGRAGPVADLERGLAANREAYFHAAGRREKRRLRERDAALRGRLAEALREAGFPVVDAERVAAWDPYDQNARADWFDPEWMFGATEGFDVTIGNPPYVRADFRDERHKASRAAILDGGGYETLWEKWDLFVPFMERSFKLLRKDGVSSLIVSDAFGHAKYALKAREWFLRNALVARVDFYSPIKIFDAAVHNLSYLFRKADGAGNEPLRRLHGPGFGDVTDLSTGAQKDLDERAFFPEDLYRPPPAPTVRLGDLCYVSKGMVVHAHERRAPGAFALADVVSDERDDRHPKPFVEGKHLDRWLPARNRWLEWGTGRAPALFSRKTFPELYDVDEKLLSVDMAAGDARPRVSFDNRRLHHNHSVWSFVPWRGLSGVRNRSIGKQARYPGEKNRRGFPRREDLETTSERFSIKFLLGVMNSTAARDFLRANRRSNIHLYPDDWKKLPIPDVPPAAQRPVVDLVDDILAVKRDSQDGDVSGPERKIDEIVRALYGFDANGAESN